MVGGCCCCRCCCRRAATAWTADASPLMLGMSACLGSSSDPTAAPPTWFTLLVFPFLSGRRGSLPRPFRHPWLSASPALGLVLLLPLAPRVVSRSPPGMLALTSAVGKLPPPSPSALFSARAADRLTELSLVSPTSPASAAAAVTLAPLSTAAVAAGCVVGAGARACGGGEGGLWRAGRGGGAGVRIALASCALWVGGCCGGGVFVAPCG